ncbi:MAG: UDP-N-acetylmuramate--alanine ligase [Burkholderiales bacterium]|nr:UDP-N-acetylmuramate--alanine ligase [Burkholderiales bacterium]
MPTPSDLDLEIAAVAARLIAEDGCDYASAKRKAARELLGNSARGRLPDNALVEQALRRYLRTFDSERHAERLGALRRAALQWMERLATFEPHLVGAVLNGTATEHSDLHLHLFTDNPKDVEMFLLDAGLAFEAEAGEDAPGKADEVLHLVVPAPRGSPLPPRLGLVLSVHAADAVRLAPRFRSSGTDLHPVETLGRAGAAQLRQLIDEAA